MYKLKYIGVYEQVCGMVGFNGVVRNGDIICIGKESFEELKAHENWQVIEPVLEEKQVKKSKKEEQ